MLARLQRSIEEEEEHWQNLLNACEIENGHLKDELEQLLVSFIELALINALTRNLYFYINLKVCTVFSSE